MKKLLPLFVASLLAIGCSAPAVKSGNQKDDQQFRSEASNKTENIVRFNSAIIDLDR